MPIEGNFYFSTDWASDFLARFDIGGDIEQVKEIKIIFDTMQFVTIEVYYDDLPYVEKKIPSWGIVRIKEELNLPFLAQALVIHIERGKFATARFYQFPLELDHMAKIMQVLEEENAPE
jgi:hypothetical protein